MCAQNAGFALGNAKIPKILATPSSLARSATHHDPPMMPHRIASHRMLQATAAAAATNSERHTHFWEGVLGGENIYS